MQENNNEILIIDDDPDILNACATMLRMRLFTVDTAKNGYDAKNYLYKKKYNIVLTDLKMPNITGMDILKDIKTNTPETDVIVFTAHGSINEAVEAMKLGAYDFITKPIDINQLGIIIKRCFERQSLVQEIGGLKEIIKLYDVSKAIVSVTDMDKLLSLIVNIAAETLKADAGSLMIYDPDDNILEVKAAAGYQKDAVIGKKLALGERIAGFVGSTRQGLLLQGTVEKDPRFEHIKPYGPVYSSLSVPIISKNILLGVLNLSRISQSKEFLPEDHRLLTIFASQTGVALENSKLFEHLKQEKATIDHMFFGMSDGAILLDKNLSITMLNPSAKLLMGFPDDACIGRHIKTATALFHSAFTWESLLISTEPLEQFELMRSSGKSLILEARAMKLYRGYPGWLLILRDITIKRQDDMVKRGFLSLLSRKLKTPLINVSNKITEILGHVPQEEISQSLTAIDTQVNILSSMVDKLIQFTLIETDQFTIIRRPCSVRAIIDQSLQMLFSLIEISNTHIAIHDTIDTLPEVHIDTSKIQEIIEYIVENAIQYNDKSDKKVFMNGSRCNKDFIQLEISDNGPGVQYEHIDDIFNQYVQSSVHGDGIGLSLIMAKKIIEAHGGTIWVENKPDQGSKFLMTLPIA